MFSQIYVTVFLLKLAILVFTLCCDEGLMDFLADRGCKDAVLDVAPVEARGMEDVAVIRPRGRGSVMRVARQSAGVVAVRRLLGSAGWRRLGLMKSKSVLRWSKPSARSAAEHKALSERMHRAKMAKVAARAVVAHAEDLQTIFSSDQVSCRTKVSIVKRKNFAGLRVVLGRLCGQRRQFTWQQMTEISLSKTSSMEGLARVYGCSARAIARIRDVTAFGLVSMQEMMLGWLLQRLRAYPPDWGLRSRLWDETGQRLVLRVNTGLPSHGQAATWQVLVARFRFAWGWHVPSAGSGDANAFLSWEPVIPAVPLLSNSAANIAAGLEAHSVTAPVHQFALHLQGLCGFWFDLAESDGATANEKFVAVRFQDQATGHLICCNHGNHLAEVAVVSVASQRDARSESKSVLNDVYASALFLRMHGHLLRLIVSLRGTLKEMLVIRHGPPPDSAIEYNACIRSMLDAEHDFTTGASSSTRWQVRLETFLQCFNGRHWLQGIVEVCRLLSSDSFLSLLLRRSPCCTCWSGLGWVLRLQLLLRNLFSAIPAEERLFLQLLLRRGCICSSC